MDLARLSQEILVGQGRPLSPGRIVRELHALEQEIGAQAGGGARLRLTTMNLVVGCSTPEEGLGLGKLLAELCADFPSRTMVAVLDPEAAEGDLQGWASFSCHPLRHGQVCCEQVALYCPGGGGASVPSLMLATLHPDLPNLLWWRGDPPFGGDLLEQMIEPMNRVVFDSREFSSSARLAEILALIQDRYHQEQAFSDLSWGRLESWREEIAALFDAPECTPCLRDLGEVEVRYHPGTRPAGDVPPQPLLLAGWLASRLGWRTGRLEDGSTTVQAGSGSLTLRLVPAASAQPDALPGDISGFRAVAGGRPPFEVKAVRAIRLRGRDEKASGLDRRARRTLERMGRELSVLNRDPVYQEALEAALQLLPSQEEVRS